ncbi:unnamed protein product, partial [Polarella glacialis]
MVSSGPCKMMLLPVPVSTRLDQAHADSAPDSDCETGTFSSSRGSSVSSDSCRSQEADPTRCLPCNALRLRWQRRRMEQEGEQAAERSVAGGPKLQRLPDGTWVTAKFWGISRHQIAELYKTCRRDDRWCDTDSVSQFVPKFVAPVTDGTQMGYALLVNQESPQQVNLMISHAWVENAGVFFEDVLANTYEHEIAYICFLSNYQGSAEEIDAQLGNNILTSPFTEVIKNPACERMMVVPNEELRWNAQGLYSRLWCDWEIKVAADSGLPISVIEQRNTDCHLLGATTLSSRNARCGDPNRPMNKDERLIRDAIKNLPPETTRSHALGLSFFCLSTAYGAEIGKVVVPGDMTTTGMIVGLLIGVALGCVFMFCLAANVRSCVARARQRDGYKVLDSIIKGAQVGSYSCRRFTMERDLPALAAVCITCGVIDGAVRCLTRANGWIQMPAAFLEGTGSGGLLWAMFNINMMGPWTGVFLVRPAAQRCCAALLAVLTMMGSPLGVYLSEGC